MWCGVARYTHSWHAVTHTQGVTEMRCARSSHSVSARSTRLDSTRLNLTRFGSTRLCSVQFGSTRFGSVRLGSARLDSTRLDFARHGTTVSSRTSAAPFGWWDAARKAARTRSARSARDDGNETVTLGDAATGESESQPAIVTHEPTNLASRRALRPFGASTIVGRTRGASADNSAVRSIDDARRFVRLRNRKFNRKILNYTIMISERN